MTALLFRFRTLKEILALMPNLATRGKKAVYIGCLGLRIVYIFLGLILVTK